MCITQFPDIRLHLLKDHLGFNASTLATRTHLDQVLWKIDFPHGAAGSGPGHTDAVVSVWKPQQEQQRQQTWRTSCAHHDSCADKNSILFFLFSFF